MKLMYRARSTKTPQWGEWCEWGPDEDPLVAGVLALFDYGPQIKRVAFKWKSDHSNTPTFTYEFKQVEE